MRWCLLILDRSNRNTYLIFVALNGVCKVDVAFDLVDFARDPRPIVSVPDVLSEHFSCKRISSDSVLHSQYTAKYSEESTDVGRMRNACT